MIATYVYHDGEGYLITDPRIEVRPGLLKGVNGYGYNYALEGDAVDGEGPIGSTLILPTASSGTHREAWYRLLVGVCSINGADDDHYDYFPSAWDAVLHLALQIDKRDGQAPSCLVDDMQRVWEQHAWRYWVSNHVGKIDGRASAAAFAAEIVPPPLGTFRGVALT